jgi:hypothetical protein
LISAEVIFMYRGTHGDLLDAKRMTAIVRALKAEKELCLQDIATFKKWRNSIEARKRKSWTMLAAPS